MRYPLVFLIILTSFGCGTSVKFARINTSPKPLTARPADEVDVFTIRPSRPYLELGIIESQQDEYSFDSMEDIIAKMRKYAGEQGCEGLIILSGNDSVSVVESSVTGGGTATVTTLKGYRGTCIVYTKAAASAPRAPRSESTQAKTQSCIPNASQLCYGPGGCRGGQACREDGRSFSPCDCGNQESAPAQAQTPAQAQDPAPSQAPENSPASK
jgi:hypothetical protein